MFLTASNFTKNIYVNQDDAGDVKGILNLRFEGQPTPEPVDEAGLWQNEAGDLYFNGAPVGGGGGGDVTAPPTQDINVITTWSPTIPKRLINSNVDIIGGLIGVNYPPLSISFTEIPAHVGTTTVWVDTNSKLSYNDNTVVGFHKSGISRVVEIPTFRNNTGDLIGGSGNVMPDFVEARHNLILTDVLSEVAESGFSQSTIIGTQMNNAVVGTTPATFSNQNVLIGNQVGTGIGITEQNCGSNVMVGCNQGRSDGFRNILFGVNNMAKTLPSAISDNLCIGVSAGIQLGSERNVLIGNYTGYTMTDPTNDDNTMIGYRSGISTLFSNKNIFIGNECCKTVSSVAGFANNTCIGNVTLSAAVSASGNVIIGDNTANSLTTGVRNVILGIDAGLSLTSGSRNIILGNTSGVGSGLVDGDNNILIDTIITNGSSTGLISIGKNNVHTQVYVQGINGYDTAAPSWKFVTIDPDGRLGAKFIVPGPAGLRVASQDAQQSGDFDLTSSFINKSLGGSNDDMIKDLKDTIEQMKSEIEALKKRMDSLNATNINLFKRLSTLSTTGGTCQ